MAAFIWNLLPKPLSFGRQAFDKEANLLIAGQMHEDSQTLGTRAPSSLRLGRMNRGKQMAVVLPKCAYCREGT